MFDRIRAFLRRLNGPVPRKYPPGNGVYCDGCDDPLGVEHWFRSLVDGSPRYYCPRCHEEVSS